MNQSVKNPNPSNLMKLTANNVETLFMSCLFNNDEVAAITNQQDPEQVVLVTGVVNRIGFHPKRLKDAEQDVRAMLDEFHDDYKIGGGGGTTFLNMCMDKHGNQWTGMHKTMDQLVCLGIGLKLVGLTPPEMNVVLPGGVPYVMINLENK